MTIVERSRSSVRWAAIGAALAVSVGVGGVVPVRATSPAGAATFVPVNPCRLFDTRPEFAIGDRTEPLGPDDTHTVNAVGTAGECELPTGASGLVLNVTAVDATQLTFLTIWPADEPQPNASSLNPSPGGPPTPNAVSVDLSDAGSFSVYNYQGSVHVLADVVGYYTDHQHDDRYYTEAEVDARVAAAVAELEARLAEHQAALDGLADEVARVDAESGAAWKPIPSGVTVIGDASVDLSTTGSRLGDLRVVELPGLPPQRIPFDHVVFAATPAPPAGVIVDRRDPTCTGNFGNPTAPPGKVCIYLGSIAGINYFSASPRTPRGFGIIYSPSSDEAGEQVRFDAVWAYTAP